MAIARNINELPLLANGITDVISANMLLAMKSSGISHDVHPKLEKYFRSSAPVSRNLALSGVGDETAALIIGIICNELKKNPSELVFNSITAL